ncbi:MAG: hypothetical protein E7612_04590 [Ruminococcaceae bacterium]|nr:hypothetical protein [Oscillospiraceae bacterium]
MTSLLHTHADAGTDIWHRIYEEVLLHGILDTLKIVAFLFVTYLLMELIEHKASGRTRLILERSGRFGPLLGGILGLAPQCGFSAAASNFYTGRVITLGTLIAIFLSTSDEMLPIMISGSISPKAILLILAYKAGVGIFVGFLIDLALKLMRIEKQPINIDGICDEDNCHCERGVIFSALHHTFTVGGFVLIITLAINALVLFAGGENISKILYDKPVISHIIAAVIGLIPNCAVSVALTDFCIEGIITAGTMLSGLFSGAGVGVLVLFKVNKNIKENLVILGILVFCGAFFGFIADTLNFSALL